MSGEIQFVHVLPCLNKTKCPRTDHLGKKVWPGERREGLAIVSVLLDETQGEDKKVGFLFIFKAGVGRGSCICCTPGREKLATVLVQGWNHLYCYITYGYYGQLDAYHAFVAPCVQWSWRFLVVGGSRQ